MKVPRENSEFERKSMRDVERSSTRQSAQSITKEYFMLKSDSQRSLRQSRNSRVSVTEDTKGRNTRQSNSSMNSRVSIVESGEKLPHSTPSQTPEKTPTPPWEPEQPTTPSLIPPPAPPPTPSTISETSKSGSSQEWKSSKSSQEWKSSKSSQEWNSSKSSQEWNSSKSSQEWKSSKFSLTQSPKDTSEDTDEDVSNWTPGRPRPPKPKNAITIAVSSRALFNMVEDNKIFENEGLEKYVEHQIANENVILRPGPAFGFIKALQNVNARLRSLYPKEQDLFDIVLMTNNHAQVGVRLINSINHHGLLIDRFCLTGGESPIGYLKSYLTNLYLSADCDKVQEAIEEGIAAATMYLGNKDLPFSETQLRVAFDGDALLFSDDFDPHVKVKEKEKPKAAPQEPFSKDKPLAQGPLKQFLEDLGRLQKKFYAKDERLLCPIRTYLITARSAASSGARVLKTLRAWGLEIDEALFLAGAPKGPILVKIRPHIFFDDDMFHIKELQKFDTIVASVPFSSPRRGSLTQEVENK